MRSAGTVSGQGVQVLPAELALCSCGLPRISHSEIAPSATLSCCSAPRFAKITALCASCAWRSWCININGNGNLIVNVNINININSSIDINCNININVLVLIIQEVC